MPRRPFGETLTSPSPDSGAVPKAVDDAATGVLVDVELGAT